MVRYAALKAGKTPRMPTPRLREGFLCLSPAEIPGGKLLEAASITGAAKYGHAIALADIPAIDVRVVGSVAVTEAGLRAGKGEGYGELEYAMLRMFGGVRGDTDRDFGQRGAARGRTAVRAVRCAAGRYRHA